MPFAIARAPRLGAVSCLACLVSLGSTGCDAVLGLDAFTPAGAGTAARARQENCTRKEECESGGAAGVCSTNEPSGCVALPSERCSIAAGAIDDPDAFRIGALLSLQGAQSASEQERLQGAQLAVEQINGAGGVPVAAPGARRSLSLIGCDVADDPVAAGRELTDELGVSAIIGPSSSQDVLALATGLTIDAQVLSVSPTAMASSLAALADDDLNWLMAPTDEQRAPLLSAQLHAWTDGMGPSPDADPVRLSLVYRNDAMGQGTRISLRSLTFNGKPITHADNFGRRVRVAFYDPESADLSSLIASQLAFEPDVILLAGAAEVVSRFMAPLEAALHARSSVHGAYRPRYLLTDASKVAELLALAADIPDLRARVRGAGVAPGEPAAFERFAGEYRERFGAGHPQIAGVAAAYDAVYAIAFALAANGGQGAGPALAAGLRALNGGARPVEAGPDELTEALHGLARRESLSVRGTLAPFAWDERGVPSRAVLQEWCLGGSDEQVGFVSSGLALDLASGAWRDEPRACPGMSGGQDRSDADPAADPQAAAPRDTGPDGADAQADGAPAHAEKAPPLSGFEAEDAGAAEPDRPELFAEYRAANADPHDSVMAPWLRVCNRGTGAGVPLHTIALRYYFTSETSPLCIRGCAAELYWAGLLPAGDELFATVTYVPSGWAAAYLEAAFASDSPSVGPGECAEVQLQFHLSDYEALDETNDYSFDAGHDAFGETARVTVHRDGALVWGEPPKP